MSDEVDSTNDRIIVDVARDVAEICRKAGDIPKGEPGECAYCGEYKARVISVQDGELACGGCRDAFKLN